MTNNKSFPHGKAAALLAYVLDIEADDRLDPLQFDQLIDDVCEDATERANLVSLLSTTQNPQPPNVILELLGTRLDRLRDDLETAEDMDAVYGIWGQRTAGGAVLASVGFIVTNVMTGGWAVLAVSAAVLASGGTSYARDRMKRRARTARRAVEQTERLIESLKRALPN